jgi:methionyl-tRNA synthetase
VQEILQDLYDRGEIYAADYDGWYDVTSEQFVTEKDLEESGGPGARPSVVRIQERNYFFRMGRYQEWLIQYIQDHPGFIQPEYRRNETLGFLRKKLQDLCISRPKSRLAWGIELPFDHDFVTYVWFDALVNYISAVGYRRDAERFARWWPVSCHLIGKDILTTHTVYWPTMLKAMGLEMPETIFAHGWWLMGGDKMSKSLGNVVNPMETIDRFGVDAFRYFVMAEMSLGQDASFSEEAFVRRYNVDLANDLGNMLSRVSKLVVTHAGGLVPTPAATGPDEQALREVVLKAAGQLIPLVKAMRIDQAVAACGAAIREANRYLERVQPWTLAKAADRGPFDTAMYTALEALRIVGGMLYPVMPGKMAALRQAIGLGAGEPDLSTLCTWGVLQPGTRLEPGGSLFPRIEAGGAAVAAPVAAGGAPAAVDSAALSAPPVAPAPAPAAVAAAGVAMIEYADFQKVRLQTARIVTAERVPKADKLLKLEVEVGGETRQIVAGIAQHYDPATLPGRLVVMVTNLKPAKIRGVESNGMLLAASSGDKLRLVGVDDEIGSGATVK